jgi:hypothetical protein
MKLASRIALLSLLCLGTGFADSTATPAADSSRRATNAQVKEAHQAHKQDMKAGKASLDSTRQKAKAKIKADREAIKAAKAKGDTAAVKAAKAELKKSKEAARTQIKAQKQELKKAHKAHKQERKNARKEH